MQGHLPKHQTGQQVADQGHLDLDPRSVNSEILNSVQQHQTSGRWTAGKPQPHAAQRFDPSRGDHPRVVPLPHAPVCTSLVFWQPSRQPKVSPGLPDCSCAGRTAVAAPRSSDGALGPAGPRHCAPRHPADLQLFVRNVTHKPTTRQHKNSVSGVHNCKPTGTPPCRCWRSIGPNPCSPQDSAVRQRWSVSTHTSLPAPVAA